MVIKNTIIEKGLSVEDNRKITWSEKLNLRQSLNRR
jgi:hypothetical protein